MSHNKFPQLSLLFTRFKVLRASGLFNFNLINRKAIWIWGKSLQISSVEVFITKSFSCFLSLLHSFHRDDFSRHRPNYPFLPNTMDLLGLTHFLIFSVRIFLSFAASKLAKINKRKALRLNIKNCYLQHFAMKKSQFALLFQTLFLCCFSMSPGKAAGKCLQCNVLQAFPRRKMFILKLSERSGKFRNYINIAFY